jgi:hypothetical protein
MEDLARELFTPIMEKKRERDIDKSGAKKLVPPMRRVKPHEGLGENIGISPLLIIFVFLLVVFIISISR